MTVELIVQEALRKPWDWSKTATESIKAMQPIYVVDFLAWRSGIIFLEENRTDMEGSRGPSLRDGMQAAESIRYELREFKVYSERNVTPDSDYVPTLTCNCTSFQGSAWR